MLCSRAIFFYIVPFFFSIRQLSAANTAIIKIDIKNSPQRITTLERFKSQNGARIEAVSHWLKIVLYAQYPLETYETMPLHNYAYLKRVFAIVDKRLKAKGHNPTEIKDICNSTRLFYASFFGKEREVLNTLKSCGITLSINQKSVATHFFKDHKTFHFGPQTIAEIGHDRIKKELDRFDSNLHPESIIRLSVDMLMKNNTNSTYSKTYNGFPNAERYLIEIVNQIGRSINYLNAPRLRDELKKYIPESVLNHEQKNSIKQLIQLFQITTKFAVITKRLNHPQLIKLLEERSTLFEKAIIEYENRLNDRDEESISNDFSKLKCDKDFKTEPKELSSKINQIFFLDKEAFKGLSSAEYHLIEMVNQIGQSINYLNDPLLRDKLMEYIPESLQNHEQKNNIKQLIQLFKITTEFATTTKKLSHPELIELLEEKSTLFEKTIIEYENRLNNQDKGNISSHSSKLKWDKDFKTESKGVSNEINQKIKDKKQSHSDIKDILLFFLNKEAFITRSFDKIISIDKETTNENEKQNLMSILPRTLKATCLTLRGFVKKIAFDGPVSYLNETFYKKYFDLLDTKIEMILDWPEIKSLKSDSCNKQIGKRNVIVEQKKAIFKIGG